MRAKKLNMYCNDCGVVLLVPTWKRCEKCDKEKMRLKSKRYYEKNKHVLNKTRAEEIKKQRFGGNKFVYVKDKKCKTCHQVMPVPSWIRCNECQKYHSKKMAIKYQKKYRTKLKNTFEDDVYIREYKDLYMKLYKEIYGVDLSKSLLRKKLSTPRVDNTTL